MSDELNRIVISAEKGQEQATELIGKLFSVAAPGTIFSEPVTTGDQTVITASEVMIGMGYGYGVGGGSEDEHEQATTAEEAPDTEEERAGLGGGGGGGGFSTGRPVAIVSVGPGGVRVEPVIDITKIGLAFLTMMISIFMIVGRARRMTRG